MKKILFLILMLSQAAFAQLAVNRYEAEMLKNPNSGGKDTREVNAVLVFEKDVLKITSRRKKDVFKEFKYAEIKYNRTFVFQNAHSVGRFAVEDFEPAFLRPASLSAKSETLADHSHRERFCRVKDRKR